MMITSSPLRWAIIFYCLAVSLFTNQLFSYELSEVDGDDISGNAPILLGWHESEFPLSWAVIQNNSPGTPVTTEAFFTAVENSFNTWDDVVTSTVTFEKANTNGAMDGIIPLSDPVIGDSFSPVRTLSGRLGPPNDDGLNNVVYCVKDGWTDDFGFSSSALAVTIFAFNTRTRLIGGGDIFINCDDIRGMWDVLDSSSPDASKYDLQNTITHEIGHFVGLGHPYSDGRETSTMYYSASGGETSKRELSEDDINGVNYLYPEPGVLLIPPDTNKDGLKDLSNPAVTGGCSLGTASAKNKIHSNNPVAFLLSYSLLFAFIWKRRRRCRTITCT